jgi:L-amino acid N-acyltransferase YncA
MPDLAVSTKVGDCEKLISNTPIEARLTVPVDAPSRVELVHLRDGCSVTIRPATAQDEPALRSFLQGLCLEARRLRFFTGAADVSKAAHWAASTGADRCGLVARDETGVLVGHAAYIQLDETRELDEKRAEVAVEVADHLHDRGLGTILIERLAMIAEQHGITHFVAEVLSENHAMLEVFREGFDGRVVLHEGPEERVEFLTSGWRLARERFDMSTRREG